MAPESPGRLEASSLTPPTLYITYSIFLYQIVIKKPETIETYIYVSCHHIQVKDTGKYLFLSRLSRLNLDLVED